MNSLNQIIYDYNKQKWLRKIKNMDAYRMWYYTFDVEKTKDDTYDLVIAPMTIWDFWKDIPRELLNDKAIRNAALETKLKMSEMPFAWRLDKEMVARVLRYDGLGLEYTSPALQNDCDIVRIAIKQNPKAIQFASEKVQKKLTKEQQKSDTDPMK